MRSPRVFLALPALAALAALTGCMAAMNTGQRSGRGSAMDFLYPKTKDGESAFKVPTVPASLQVPMKVGLAFAPEESAWQHLEPVLQDGMLDQVAKKLGGYPFIEKVVIIPPVYLQRGGGFGNLRQIKTLFGVDVIGLVSYDQIANTSENAGGFFYLTIIGRYFIPGNSHSVRTLMDLLLLDPTTETLLCRAAGESELSGATPDAFSDQRVGELSREGYRKAIPPLLADADAQFTRLRDDIQSGRRTDVKLAVKPGYDKEKLGGWGAGDPWLLAAAAALLGGLAVAGLRRASSGA